MIRLDLHAIAPAVSEHLADLFRDARPTPLRKLYLRAHDGDGTYGLMTIS